MGRHVVMLLVLGAACGDRRDVRNEPPSPAPVPVVVAPDAVLADSGPELPVRHYDFDAVFAGDDERAIDARVRALDSEALQFGFRNHPRCVEAARLARELRRRKELDASWGPLPNASPADLTQDLCVNSNDGNARERRARLRHYLADAVTVTETRCKSTHSEERVETTYTVTPDKNLERLDRLLREGRDRFACESNDGVLSCEFAVGRGDGVQLTWTADKLTRVLYTHMAVFPCVPD